MHVDSKKESSCLLSVNNLYVEFRNDTGTQFRALNDVSFDINYGEIFGIIGESGAGKSVLAHSIIGLLEGFPGVVNGTI